MYRTLIILVIMLLFPAFTGGEVLTSDTVWSEEILVSDDIVVPEGITLTVLAETVGRVLPSDSTKIDPEYVSLRTEITIPGTLNIQGEADAVVSFSMGENDNKEMPDPWTGIIRDEKLFQPG